MFIFVKGKPMEVYNRMISCCSEFFMSSHIELRTMQDYEVVCKTLLNKYSRLNTEITQLCRLENAGAKKKAVKRLHQHVNF